MINKNLLRALTLMILTSTINVVSYAQDAPDTLFKAPEVQKHVRLTIKLEHGINRKIHDYIEFFDATTESNDESFKYVVAPELGWIHVEGKKNLVAEFEENIREFDVPGADPEKDHIDELMKLELLRARELAEAQSEMRDQQMKEAARMREMAMEREALERDRAQNSKPVELTIKLKNGVTPKIQELTQMFANGLTTLSPRRGRSSPPELGGSSSLNIHLSESLGWIRVLGDKVEVERFAELVDEVDVKPANVELTFYLLRAMEEEGDVQYPKTLEPTIKQLAKTFQYGSYQLIETTQLRGREGRTIEHRSGIPLSKINQDGEGYINAKYDVEIGRMTFYKDEGQDAFGFDVHLSVKMEKPLVVDRATPVADPQQGFTSRTPRRYISIGSSMESEVDIREGQSVVLGKSNFDSTTDALFVIVQARAVD